MGLIYELAVKLSRFGAYNFFSLQIYGRENLIEEGPALLAMNHQSYLDPPLAAICCDREIHFLARKDLFDTPLLGRVLRNLNVIGLERDGSDMSALKTVIRLLKNGGSTIVFPEGTRTRDGQLAPARPGIGLIVAKSLAPVVPMRIFGAFDAFPRTAKFPRRAPITIVIGEPMHFTKADVDGDPRAVYQGISERVMARIAALKNPRRD
jgi:1-acyl-sn-glycerol-3-phosphate acyltransferase